MLSRNVCHVLTVPTGPQLWQLKTAVIGRQHKIEVVNSSMYCALDKLTFSAAVSAKEV